MIHMPRRLTVLTTLLLVGGMSVFLLNVFAPLPLARVIVSVGSAVFAAGLLASLVAMVWSIRTLNSPEMRNAQGVTTAIFTILVAALAWGGTLLTLYKYKRSHDQRVTTASEEMRREQSPIVNTNSGADDVRGTEK